MRIEKDYRRWNHPEDDFVVRRGGYHNYYVWDLSTIGGHNGLWNEVVISVLAGPCTASTPNTKLPSFLDYEEYEVGFLLNGNLSLPSTLNPDSRSLVDLDVLFDTDTIKPTARNVPAMRIGFFISEVADTLGNPKASVYKLNEMLDTSVKPKVTKPTRYTYPFLEEGE